MSQSQENLNSQSSVVSPGSEKKGRVLIALNEVGAFSQRAWAEWLRLEGFEVFFASAVSLVKSGDRPLLYSEKQLEGLPTCEELVSFNDRRATEANCLLIPDGIPLNLCEDSEFCTLVSSFISERKLILAIGAGAVQLGLTPAGKFISMAFSGRYSRIVSTANLIEVVREGDNGPVRSHWELTGERSLVGTLADVDCPEITHRFLNVCRRQIRRFSSVD